MDIKSSAIIVVALLLTTPLQAELFKWVDSTGSTVYSNTPPPEGVETLPTPIILEPSNDAAKAAENAEAMKKAADEIVQQSNQQKLEKETIKTEQAKQQQIAETCDKLRANLEVLKLQRRIFQYDENGEKRILSPEERDAKAVETEEKINTHCKK